MKINKDILRVVDPSIPVSSRLWGLIKDVVKCIEKILRVVYFTIIEQVFLRCLYLSVSLCFHTSKIDPLWLKEDFKKEQNMY